MEMKLTSDKFFMKNRFHGNLFERAKAESIKITHKQSCNNKVLRFRAKNDKMEIE
jgi:hypothetical protein